MHVTLAFAAIVLSASNGHEVIRADLLAIVNGILEARHLLDELLLGEVALHTASQGIGFVDDAVCYGNPIQLAVEATRPCKRVFVGTQSL